MRILLCAATCALSASLTAQSITTPLAATGGDAPASTAFPWDQSSQGRALFVYPNTHFQTVGEVMGITRLRFRADAGQTGSGGTFQQCRVDMSTAANPSTALGTSFTGNHGPDRTTVFNGTLTVNPTTGAGTEYVVDVVLNPPFYYNPVLGSDLAIDVRHGSYAGDSMGRLLDGYTDGSQGSRLFNANSRSAASGVVDGEVPVIEIEYITGIAAATAFGTGCGGNGTGSSAWELFDAGSPFDMSNSGWAAFFSPPSYLITPGLNPIVPPTGAAISFGDDDTQQITLPWPFVRPDGTVTNDIWVCSNGWVSIESTSDTTYTEDVDDLHNDPIFRICALWDDLAPHNGGTIHAEVDPTNPAYFHVTWTGVPEYFNTGSNDFQITFDSGGGFEVKYGNIGSTDSIVGFSPGHGSPNNGPIDMNVDGWAGWVPGSDTDELALLFGNGDRPVMGQNFDLDIDQIPLTATGTALFLSFQRLPGPGLDLTVAGMTGCNLYVGNLLASMPVPAPQSGYTSTVTLPMPTNMVFAGLSLYAQAACAGVQEVSPLPVATSNGVVMTIDQN